MSNISVDKHIAINHGVLFPLVGVQIHMVYLLILNYKYVYKQIATL